MPGQKEKRSKKEKGEHTRDTFSKLAIYSSHSSRATAWETLTIHRGRCPLLIAGFYGFETQTELAFLMNFNQTF